MLLEIGLPLNAVALREDFPIFRQRINGSPLVWMDNASTTQKPRQVIDALARFYERDNSNVHRAIHALGTRATDAYEAAREKARRFIGARSAAEIVFTRGTTEALNLVAGSYGRQTLRSGDEILLSTLEHHSNIVPWQMLAEERGAIVKAIPIDERGEIRLDEYARLLNPRTRVVGLTHVANTVGTILPLKEMIAMARGYGARTVIDGAQAVAHLRVNVLDLDCDFYAFSGHKMFGPTGIGVLYGKHELLEEMKPWQGGGSMIREVTFERTTFAAPPARFEAGTPSIADAIGLGAAIDYLESTGMDAIERYDRQLTEYAMSRLAGVPGLRTIGAAVNRVGVLSFVLDGFTPEEVGGLLAERGICTRAGHHCAQPTMQRYGVSGTVRPSLAFYNLPEEVDVLVDSLRSIAREKSL